MHNRLAVAAGPKHVPGSLQPAAQRAEVVDLAIEDHPHRAIFVRQRLIGQGQINDRQAAEPERHAGSRAARVGDRTLAAVEALIVRPAMAQHVGHSCKGLLAE